MKIHKSLAAKIKKFSMAPDSLLPFLFLCCSLLLLSVTSSESFPCGDFKETHITSTNTTYPECGLLPIRGCDNSSAYKEVQFGNRGWFQIEKIFQKDDQYILIVRDHQFQELLNSKNCSVFDYDVPIPPESPALSSSLLNRINPWRCNYTLSNNFNYFLHHKCSDYSIYFDPKNLDGQVPRLSSACSVIQLPLNPQSLLLPHQSDPLALLTAEIHIEIRPRKSHLDCLQIRGGQCQLDGKCSAHEHRGIDSKALIIGVAIVSVGVIIIVLSIILLVKVHTYNCSGFLDQSRSNYYDIQPITNPECASLDVGVPIFSYEELEKATNNFDPSRELGHGGFGTVYYGKLGDGREVAVKRLYDHKRDSKRVKQFMNEIEAFTRLRHRNLVSLYGCTSPQSRRLLLAYEYISNGTLASHLHGDLAKPGSLPWPRRMKISVETATALAYLHGSDIIHLDIKTNNILLDNNLCVKVADFGISRFFPNDVSHVSTSPQGTMGYIDPEYLESHHLTNKSDVYSFGVVFIELISSMPAVDQTRKEDEIKLANLAIKKIQNREFTELVDPSLGFESNNEYKRMMISVAELAFQCLQRDKEQRPSMYKVLDELQKISRRKDEPQHLEILGVGILGTDTHMPPPTIRDWEEVGSIKKMNGQRLHQTL